MCIIAVIYSLSVWTGPEMTINPIMSWGRDSNQTEVNVVCQDNMPGPL